MRTVATLFFLLISEFVLRGQVISGGTAVVMVRTPSRVSLAVDSKEIQYHLDHGVLSKSETCASKATRVGDFVAVVAGFSRGSGGFDVLDTITAQSEAGDSFDRTLEKADRQVSRRLQQLIQELWKAQIDIRTLHNPGDPALQVGFIGVENRVTKTAVLEFFVDDPSGEHEVRSTRKQCPGDCQGKTNAYLLGSHSAIQTLLASSPQIMNDLSLKQLERLIGEEERAHPEIVGGPVVTATGGLKGQMVLNSNGCGMPFEEPEQKTAIGADSIAGEAGEVAESVTSLLDTQLDQVAELQCHRSIRRFVKDSRKYRQLDQVELDVEMHSGDEKYSRIQRKKKDYQRIEDLPGSWSSGELASVIRVTRNAIASGRFYVEQNGGEKSLDFSVSAAERQWFLMVEGTQYWLNVQGKVHFRDGEIVGIELTGSGLPAQSTILDVTLSIAFAEAPISGKPFRVPERSEFRVNYLDPIISSTLDRSSYTEFRRLGATVNISFED